MRPTCSHGEIGARLEIVVIVLRDRQKPDPPAAEFRDSREHVVRRQCDVLDAGAEEFGEEPRRLRALALGGVENDAKAAVGVSITWLCTTPPGSTTSCHRSLPDIEQRCVEQKPGQHFLVVHGLGNVIDRGQSGARDAASLCRLELHVPEPAELLSCRRRSRRRLPPTPRTAGMSSSPGPTLLAKGCVEELVGAFDRCRRIVEPAAPGRRPPGRCVMLKEWAKPSLSQLTTMLMSPCCQRVTALDR